MNLPMQVFWHLSGTVPRLTAGERKEHLELLVSSAHSSDGVETLFKALQDASPDPVKLTGYGMAQRGTEVDIEGLGDLRSMGSL